MSGGQAAIGSAGTSAALGTRSEEGGGSIPPIAEAGRATERPETRGMAGEDSGRVDIFLGMFWMDVPNFCSHSHPPPAETVFRVNPIWPIPFHCLRHTTVSTPHENTPGPHIPAGFWKWVGPRRHVRGRKGSAWATSGGSVWIWKSTPLSPSKSRPENEPQGWPISRLTSA